MKLLTLLLITLFVGKGCDSSEKNDLDTAVVEYTAYTRGYYQKITVQNQTFFVSKDREGNDKTAVTPISDKDWKELVAAFQNVKPDALAELKAPTDKRTYDGAAIGNLRIVLKDKQYETTGFDNGYPPAEIEELVTKIVSLVKKE